MVDVVLHAFTTLFVVIDPIALLPVLLALTPGSPRRRAAGWPSGHADRDARVLLGFALVGDVVLGLLGIGLPAFRIAGGVMLLLIALEMVFERRTERRSRSADEMKTIGGPDDISVFPLAVPLLAGPGAITSVMLLMARYEGDLAAQATVVSMLLLVMALSCSPFTSSSRSSGCSVRRSPTSSRACLASCSPRWRCSTCSTASATLLDCG